jgi:hypothetical protein
MKAKYGLSLEQYQVLLFSQGGACAICKFIPGPGDNRLCVDHDHVTGKVRGLLCDRCNTGMGYFRDCPDFLNGGIKYLNSPILNIVYKRRLSWSVKKDILVAQDYKCKICSTDLHNKRACVDHDHLTNMVRGILCDRCNCGLGQFRDSTSNLYSGIRYLTGSEIDASDFFNIG